MTAFLQLCVAGLAQGSLYALVGLGFVVIYKATGVINFAQGGFVVLGAYFTYNAHRTWHLPFALAILVGVLGCAAVGGLIERVILRRMVGQPVFAVIMVTIGLLFVLEQVVTGIWGPNPLQMGDPWGVSTLRFGRLSILQKDAWTIAIAAVVLAAFFVFFRYSRLGVAMRATAFDQEAAVANGISARRIFGLSWAIAAGVGTLAGVMLGSGAAGVRPDIEFIALLAFPAIILGGLDSPEGAIVGGVVIGLTQQLTSGYEARYLGFLGAFGHGFGSVTPYLVMIAILLVRPYGLFGTKEVRRV